jgi:hypothetical protein
MSVDYLNVLRLLEAAIGIEPMNKGFADLCLTTWLRRRKATMKEKGGKMNSFQSAVYSFQPRRLGLATTLKTAN